MATLTFEFTIDPNVYASHTDRRVGAVNATGACTLTRIEIIGGATTIPTIEIQKYASAVADISAGTPVAPSEAVACEAAVEGTWSPLTIVYPSGAPAAQLPNWGARDCYYGLALAAGDSLEIFAADMPPNPDDATDIARTIRLTIS